MNVSAIGAKEILYLTLLVSVVTLLFSFLLIRLKPLGFSSNSRNFLIFLGAITLLSSTVTHNVNLDSKSIGLVSVSLISLALLLPGKSALHKHDYFVGEIPMIAGVMLREQMKRQLVMSITLFGIFFVLISIVFNVGIIV